MSLLLQNPQPDQEMIMVGTSVLSDEAKKVLNEYISTHELTSAETRQPTDEEASSAETRKTDIMWIESNETTAPLYWNIANIVQGMNSEKWSFDINCIETLQYSVYEEGGHYITHSDAPMVGQAFQDNRKLSFSILLNDPDDFEGGELDVTAFHQDGHKLLKDEMLMFPSMMPHSVTPVTKGTRKALVGWVRGPNWR